MLVFLVHDYFRKDQGKKGTFTMSTVKILSAKNKTGNRKKNRKEMRIVF